MRTLSSFLSALVLLVLPTIVFATVPGEIWIYCGDLPGCGSSVSFQEYVTNVFQLLGSHFAVYIYAIGVLMIMVGGAQMLLSAGREDWVTKGKTTITWAVIGIATANFVTLGVGSGSSLLDFIGLEVQNRVPNADLVLSATSTLISTIFDLLFVAILGVALYCGMWMVVSLGKQEQFDKAKEGLFWAAIGAIAINLAQVIANAFATL